MNLPKSLSLLPWLLFASLLSPCAALSQEPLGRWGLTLPDGRAGWLEVMEQDGWYDGSILWGGGSVVPLASVVVQGDEVTLTRIQTVERKDKAGKIVRTQHLTETISGKADGDILRLTRTRPRLDGRGIDREDFAGERLPPLPAPPDLSRLTFDPPVALFNGRDLSGWRLLDDTDENGWRVEEGCLVNQPAPAAPGESRRRFGNLRTDEVFEDFRITLEVNVPEGSNSGVYLRGLYEVQVADTFGKPLNPHNMGAIYSRLTPIQAAERPAGEWQSLDITLADRHVTVILNGQLIIDNQPLAGCTGGALWSDVTRPGPLYLQGDHGPVRYRNLVLYPRRN